MCSSEKAAEHGTPPSLLTAHIGTEHTKNIGGIKRKRGSDGDGLRTVVWSPHPHRHALWVM